MTTDVERSARTGLACVFKYDGLGRRVLKSATLPGKTFYVFDGDLLLGEVSVPFVGQPFAAAAYTWGAAGLVSERLVSESRSLWYHFGPQGETRQLTNSSGNTVDTYVYRAYGLSVSVSGSDPNPFRYGGQVGYYTETYAGAGGLVLCGVRWYQPNEGRWLTRDPIGYEGGSNLYEYCKSSPVRYIDPSGLQTNDSVSTYVAQAFLRGGLKEAVEAVGYKFAAFGARVGLAYAGALAAHPRITALLQTAVRGLPNTIRLANRSVPACRPFANQTCQALSRNLRGLEEVEPRVFEFVPRTANVIHLREGGQFAWHSFVVYGNRVFDSLTGPKGQEWAEWVKRFTYVNSGKDWYDLFKFVPPGTNR